MSAFDYPRLMLTGTAVCSPSTGNNCRFVPLAVFDPITGKSVSPPRLFILEDKVRVKKLCREKGFEVKIVTIGCEEYEYVEIAPEVLKDPQKYKDWARIPLGEYDGDVEYHELYTMTKLKIIPGRLSGNKPGYYNYYGTTTFEFKDVKVGSIALNAKQPGEKLVKEKDGSEEYEDLAELFQMELKINEGMWSKAKIVDSASSVSMATQVFWDKLTLRNSSGIAFSGKPCKASLRFSSASRVFDLPREATAHCASGTFFSSVRIEDIENGQDAVLIRRLFEKYKTRNEELIGLQIVFNLFEVKENVDLEVKPGSPNNAETKIVVAITPWYRGDLKSISMGRQLNAGVNYLKKCYEKDAKIKDYFLSPIVAQVDYNSNYLMLDLMNNIPEVFVPRKPPNDPPYPIPGRDDDRFQTMDVGMLKCKLYESGKELGSISLDPINFSRSYYLERAGRIVFHQSTEMESIDYEKRIRNERIALYLYDSTGKHNLIGKNKDDYVMLESEFMLASDSGSLYASANDDPAHGYLSYSGTKEPCKITIYRKGFEYSSPIPITILQLEVKPWNLNFNLSRYRVAHYRNNDVVTFPTENPFNGLYLLYPNVDAPTVERLQKEVYTDPTWRWYYLMTYFNSYIGVRILPYQDYSAYLDLNKKDGRLEVTFDVLKKEIFDNYDLLYPLMAKIFPFEEAEVRRRIDRVFRQMSLENWENSSYMPVSRDLSPQQFRLFLEWMHGNHLRTEGGTYHHSAAERIEGQVQSGPQAVIPR